jgi:hypothetical protein
MMPLRMISRKHILPTSRASLGIPSFSVMNSTGHEFPSPTFFTPQITFTHIPSDNCWDFHFTSATIRKGFLSSRTISKFLLRVDPAPRWKSWPMPGWVSTRTPSGRADSIKLSKWFPAGTDSCQTPPSRRSGLRSFAI